MSTVNTLPNSQTPAKLPELGEPKFTAAQIDKDCPAHLQRIGEEITKRFLQAQEQAKVLDDQVIELKKLIAEAKELCDGDGFDAFREKFFPNLRQSRVYELLAIGTNKKSIQEVRASTRARVSKHRAVLAIGTNKKSIQEVRASTRARVSKHRANKAADAQFRYSNGNSEPDAQGALKQPGEIEAPSIASPQTPEPSKCPSTVASAAAANSETVPEKSRMQGAPNANGEIEAPGIASEQTPEPSKPWTERASVEGMRVFTVHTTGLNKATKKRPPEHFSETTVSVEILEQLGHLFTRLANIMKSEAVKPAPIMAQPGDGTDSAGQPTVNAEDAAPEASIDGVALHEHV